MMHVGQKMGYFYRMGQCPKNFSLFALKNIIEFGQCLVQGVWQRPDELLQLPHITEDRLKKIRRRKKTLGLLDVVRMSDADREALGLHENEQELSDINAACRVIPCPLLQIRTAVEGEAELVQGDVATVALRIHEQRERSATGEVVPASSEAQEPCGLSIEEEQRKDERAPRDTLFVHSNRFSHKKKHGWILLVTDMDEKNLIVFQTLVSDQPVVKFWIKHQLQAPGLQRVKVTVMSDSYVGVDQSTVVEYRVKGLEEGKREVKYDPEDLATYDEKNMMEQLMSVSPSFRRPLRG